MTSVTGTAIHCVMFVLCLTTSATVVPSGSAAVANKPVPPTVNQHVHRDNTESTNSTKAPPDHITNSSATSTAPLDTTSALLNDSSFTTNVSTTMPSPVTTPTGNPSTVTGTTVITTTGTSTLVAVVTTTVTAAPAGNTTPTTVSTTAHAKDTTTPTATTTRAKSSATSSQSSTSKRPSGTSPTVKIPSTTPGKSQQLQLVAVKSGYTGGELFAAILGGCVIGALVCLLLMYVKRRYFTPAAQFRFRSFENQTHDQEL